MGLSSRKDSLLHLLMHVILLQDGSFAYQVFLNGHFHWCELAVSSLGDPQPPCI